MEKTATLNSRVNPVVKKQAEEVLSQLGIPYVHCNRYLLVADFNDRWNTFSVKDIKSTSFCEC